jgi:hypothetical protein
MVLEKFEPEVVEPDGEDGGDDEDEPPAIKGLPWRLVVLHESAPAP